MAKVKVNWYPTHPTCRSVSMAKYWRLLYNEIADVDPVTKGSYLIDTLNLDKNNSKESAINDIYKVFFNHKITCQSY